MNLDQVEKKLRECHFFLSKIIEQERKAFGDKEPFDFYLSAFLGAGTTVRNGFHTEQDRKRNKEIKVWREKWEGSLPMEENHLYQFMGKDRIAEIHKGGSDRGVKTEGIEVGFGGTYSDASGTVEIGGVPHPLAPGMSPAAVIYKPAYSFTIAGTEQKATEACREYVALLDRMLVKFKADDP